MISRRDCGILVSSARDSITVFSTSPVMLEARRHKHTLECAGNGCAFAVPPVPGIQWRKGAVVGGRELAEDLRRTIPSLNGLFLSGYTGGPALHLSVQESGTAYVQKPFSMRFLARKIREVLDGASAGLVHPKADAAATM